MKKFLSIIAILVLVLSACQTSSSTTSEEIPADACDNGQTDITLVTDTGGIHDKSFNQSAWEGVRQYCHESDEIGATYIESDDESQLEQNLNIAAGQSDVVVASGFLFESPLYNSAVANPDTKYILIDAQPVNPDTGEAEDLENVQSYFFDEAQAGYLVGYIAASKTDTDHIGFVGGIEIPPVQKFGWGYIAGAQAVNPDIVIDYSYTGSFNDSGLGKTTADTMYGSGADIVFTAAGGVNAGVMQSAIDLTTANYESPSWVIGVDRDTYEEGLYTDADGEQASVVLTSAVKKVNQAVYDGLVMSFDGSFTGGVTTLTYEDGGVGIPDTNPNLEGDGDQEIIDAAKSSLEENIDSVPETADQIETTIVNPDNINGKY